MAPPVYNLGACAGLYFTHHTQFNSNMVPGAGIEPARGFPRGILSPLRLPVSPPGLIYINKVKLIYMEAEPGIEPRSTALQAAA